MADLIKCIRTHGAFSMGNEWKPVERPKFVKDLNLDDDEPSRNNHERDSSRREVSAGKTVLCTVIVMGSVGLLATGGSVTNAAINIGNTLTPKVETEVGITEQGKYEIIDLDLTVPDITLATATTRVTGVVGGYEQIVSGIFGDVSLGDNTKTREANVETQIVVNPKDANFSYNPETLEMIISAPDTSFSTKVDIPTGEAKTVDETGNFAMLPAEWLTAISDAVDGTFGTDNSEVPILNDIVEGTLEIDEGLEQYIDLSIVVNTDEYCTEKIPEVVEDFDEQIKDNFREAVRGMLLDPEATNELSAELKELTIREAAEVVDNAVIELPENYNIGPDEGNIAKLRAYEETGVFTSTLNDETPIECGIAEDPTLTLVEDEE